MDKGQEDLEDGKDEPYTDTAGHEQLLGKVLEHAREDLAAPFEGQKLSGSRVIVNQEECGEGHIHRTVMLVREFNEAGALPGESVPDFDEAYEEFREKVLDFPEDARGLLMVSISAGHGVDQGTGNDVKLVILEDAFHTAASLEREQDEPQTLDEMLDAMGMSGAIGDKNPDGPGGLN